jgi:hypothetical protein
MMTEFFLVGSHIYTHKRHHEPDRPGYLLAELPKKLDYELDAASPRLIC